MLDTKKMKIFTILSGKPRAAGSIKDHAAIAPQEIGKDNRITITRSEDFYKAHTIQVANLLSFLNR